MDFKVIGKLEEGFLTIAEKHEISFDIKRVFWTVDTPVDTIRGRHAHHETAMILIAAKGKIKVATLSKNNKANQFTLQEYNQALFIPPMCWHEMSYSQDAVQIVLANTDYDENDYIRNKNQFIQLINKI